MFNRVLIILIMISVPEAQSTHDSDNESKSHHASQLHASGELISATEKHHDLLDIDLNISQPAL